jgi:hypothetical protein
MANTSVRRTVSRPGVSAEGTGSNFQSPYQPPPALADFAGDLAMLDPTGYTTVHDGEHFWRVKVPGPVALQRVAEIADASGGQQILAINAFLRDHMHPEDFALILRRLLNPDDTFTNVHYMELYRQAVTVGTARPFRQLWASPAPPSTAGASSVRSSPSPVFLRRYQR